MKKALIIGYGSIGQRHTGLLASLGLQVAVLSRRNIDHPKRYGRLDEALSRFSPDLVIVASATNEHYQDIEKLAKSDFKGAVLVEKPLFDTSRKFPKNHFGHVAIAFNLRFHPLVQKFRSALRNRQVFALHASVGQYLPDWRPETDYRKGYSASKAKGGGVLRDLSHEIDLVLWLGGKCRSMTALGGKTSDLEIDSDDAFALLLELDRCPVATVTMNYLDTELHRELVAHTDRGTLRADLARGTLSDGKDEEIFDIGNDDAFLGQLKAALEGDRETLCSLAEGEAVMTVIAAADKSSLERIWVQP